MYYFEHCKKEIPEEPSNWVPRQSNTNKRIFTDEETLKCFIDTKNTKASQWQSKFCTDILARRKLSERVRSLCVSEDPAARNHLKTCRWLYRSPRWSPIVSSALGTTRRSSYWWHNPVRTRKTFSIFSGPLRLLIWCKIDSSNVSFIHFSPILDLML